MTKLLRVFIVMSFTLILRTKKGGSITLGATTGPMKPAVLRWILVY